MTETLRYDHWVRYFSLSSTRVTPSPVIGNSNTGVTVSLQPVFPSDLVRKTQVMGNGQNRYMHVCLCVFPPTVHLFFPCPWLPGVTHLLFTMVKLEIRLQERAWTKFSLEKDYAQLMNLLLAKDSWARGLLTHQHTSCKAWRKSVTSLGEECLSRLFIPPMAVPREKEIGPMGLKRNIAKPQSDQPKGKLSPILLEYLAPLQFIPKDCNIFYSFPKDFRPSPSIWYCKIWKAQNLAYCFTGSSCNHGRTSKA